MIRIGGGDVLWWAPEDTPAPTIGDLAGWERVDGVRDVHVGDTIRVTWDIPRERFPTPYALAFDLRLPTCGNTPPTRKEG